MNSCKVLLFLYLQRIDLDIRLHVVLIRYTYWLASSTEYSRSLHFTIFDRSRCTSKAPFTMPGKRRAWIRKKIENLRRLCHKDKPATYCEDAFLIPRVSSSTRSSAPQSSRIRADNVSSATSPDTLPRPLVCPYSGAYPSRYPTPYPTSRPGSVASSRPESIAPLISESVAPTKRRLGRMQKPPGRRPPHEFQYLNDVPEAKPRALRQQISAMSTNTIGWDTPIGDYAGEKQIYLHPTGLLELRRPESAARIQEMEAVADCDFRCKG